MDQYKELEKYYQYATKEVIKKGEYITDHSFDNDSKYAYFLHTGICALMSFSKDGYRKVHLYFSAKRVIGFAKMGLIKTNIPFSKMILQAKSDCIIYKITKEQFTKLMNEDLSFSNLMYQILTENYLNIFRRYMQIEEESVPVRVSIFLLEYCEIKNGQQYLPLLFTYNEIADYLSIHPVTVSRVMIALKKIGGITRQGRGVVIVRPFILEKIIAKEVELDY